MENERARILSIIVIIALIVGSHFFGISQSAAKSGSAKAVEWKAVSLITAGLPWEMNKLFAENIKKMSGGQFNIEILPSGSIVPTMEELTGVGKGALDAGFLYPGYWSEKVPISLIEAGVPGTVKTYSEFMILMNERGVRNLVEEAYAERNIKIVGWAPGPNPEILVSKVPINHVEDLKGLKFRSASVTAKVLKKLGAAVVFAPPPEIYTMLATGTIDGATFASLNVNYKMGFHEVAKNWMFPGTKPLANFHFIVNMDKWQKLPDDFKAMIEEECYAWGMRWWTKQKEENRRMLKTLRESGVTVNIWSSEDIEKISQAARTFFPEYGKKDPRLDKALKEATKFADELGY